MASVNGRSFDLEARTLAFAKAVRVFVKELPRSTANIEDGKQVIRSSGSVGANYIEANEALSKKDFIMRVKIARKEAKESRYWLQIVEAGSLEKERTALEREATELTLILSSIIRRAEV